MTRVATHLRGSGNVFRCFRRRAQHLQREGTAAGRFAVTQRWFRPDMDRQRTRIAAMPIVARKRPYSSQISRSRRLRLRRIQNGMRGQRTTTFARRRVDHSRSEDGSGENAMFLYHVARDGPDWRLSQHLDDLVWSALLTPLHLTRAVTTIWRSCSFRGSFPLANSI